MSDIENGDIPEDVENVVDKSLGEPTRRERASRRKKAEPVYKMVGGSKIPISKSYGKVWMSRRDLGLKVQEDVSGAWEEAIRYFENDQTGHRVEAQRHGSGNVTGNQKLNDNITETENVVFSNVTTMVPALYARNPRAEFTPTDEANQPAATLIERVVNILGSKKSMPGFNMKPKAKRCVVTALLTNRAWVCINWVFKQDSSEQALANIQEVAQRLEKAKDAKKIKEIEGELMALEDAIEILQPEGPTVKVKSPFDVVIDPSAQEVDLSDAHWAMYCEYLPTSFLLAKYAKKVKDSQQYKSIYKPTHVLKMGVGDDQGHDKMDFQLIDPKEQASNFGFSSEQEFEKAAMTKVWYVWDKVTRRLLMYHDGDWTWPIWVWDDPLQLDCFFPLYPLTFFESPSGPLTKGEVSYYLDQQDAINEITDEVRRARRWARRNVFYDSNRISRDDAEAVLNGDDGTARGVKLPEGYKLGDVIGSVPVPSLQHKEIFNKEDYYKAIDRIGTAGEVLRGGQFKTNTNKDAVQANVSASNMRIDEKSDAIEDWIGQIYWGIAQLCLQYMSPDLAISLIGEAGSEWKTYSPEEISSTFSMHVVGGSAQKPTSQAKKEEALELGQVLGQFVNAAPGPVLKVMLEVMQEAFDEINIKEEDWDEIIAAVAPQQQQPSNGPSNSSPDGQAVPQGQAAPQAQGQVTPENIDQILAQLPPEAKQAILGAIEQGVDPQQAIQQVMQQISQ